VKAEEIPFKMAREGTGELQFGTSLGGYGTLAAARAGALPGSAPPRALIPAYIKATGRLNNFAFLCGHEP
jgi:hypothetical protein